MKVLYSWLKDYTDYSGSADDAAMLLTEHSYEVESIEASPLDNARGKGKDAIFDIDVLANRAVDSLSHIGVARELAAVADANFDLPAIELHEGGPSAADAITVTIDDEELCPRYVGRVVRGVVVKESPKWLKDRLGALGLRSINTIVDVTNYVMLEYGQPLHAFDYDKLEGATIAVRRARANETITTLDNEEVELSEEMLIIADAADPLAIAGIKGGTKAEIGSDTTTIVLESAAFNPVSVRRTSRAIGIQTESSRRFEAGVDLTRPLDAIDRAAQLIAEVAGGDIAAGRVDVGREPEAAAEITVRPEAVQDLLGIEVEMKTMISILERLQFSAKEESGFLVVTPPATRQDVRTVPDVIEEIARMHGYNAIPSTPPLAHLVPLAQRQDYDVELLVRETLVGLGMVEVRNYSFLNLMKIEEFYGINKVEQAVKIENALSRDLEYLRPSLLPRLLMPTAVKNVQVKVHDPFRLFEIGNVFHTSKKSSSSLPEEMTNIAGVFVHNGGDREDLYKKAKGVIEALFERLGVDVEFREMKEGVAPFAVGEKVMVNEGELGVLGVFGTEVLKKFNFQPVAVVGFEFNLKKLISAIEGEREYTAFSRYPTVSRDVAVIVSGGVKVSSVLNTIEVSGAQLVTDVDFLNMYSGEEVGEDATSLAFRIIYQSEDRTLTDEEVNEEHKKVVKALEKMGWEVR